MCVRELLVEIDALESNFIVYISPFDLFSLFLRKEKNCTHQTKRQTFDTSTMDRVMGTQHARKWKIDHHPHNKI